MSSEKSYINPDFTEAFQRVKEILIDLKNRIMPVKQGNAVNFRQNINDAIGTIPETDQETGDITKDGYGMSGAVFAMGEAFEIGLQSLGDTLKDFDNDAQIILKEATESKNNILEYEGTALTSKNNILEYEKVSSESKESIDNILSQVDSSFSDASKKFEQALADAAGNANQAADRANSAAQGITNTFVCLAQGNSETETAKADSYPVTIDAEGNETKITQSLGAVWFKIVSEVNTSTENTENTETV